MPFGSRVVGKWADFESGKESGAIFVQISLSNVEREHALSNLSGKKTYPSIFSSILGDEYFRKREASFSEYDRAREIFCFFLFIERE